MVKYLVCGHVIWIVIVVLRVVAVVVVLGQDVQGVRQLRALRPYTSEKVNKGSFQLWGEKY